MIDILEKAAREAGKLLLNYFQTNIAVRYKTTHKNIVTQVDLESQELIKKVILSEMAKKGIGKNECGFICEENFASTGTHMFIIDPLDGTNNFASGFEYFNVTIAYMKNGVVLSGLVYNPINQALYFAKRSKGAFKTIGGKNAKKLKMDFRPLKSLLIAGILHGNTEAYQKELVVSQKMFPYVRGIRITHSTALDLANIASNVFGISYSAMCSIWDIAAGKLIVEESGGVFVDWNGDNFTCDTGNPTKYYHYLACHPKLLPNVLPFFKD